MRSKQMAGGRVLMVFGIVLAGLCLFRVLTVSAAEDVEIYEATEQDEAQEAQDERDSEDRAEIRLSRPDEAASRVAEDQGYDMVPGAARLLARENSENALIVPRKVRSGIGSREALPESPVAVRDGARYVAAGRTYPAMEPGTGRTPAGTVSTADIEPAPSPTSPYLGSKLNAEVIEPRPFTARDAQERASEARSEVIVAAQSRTDSRGWGLHNEAGPETRIDPPVPQSPVRAGVQEVSLIVSDYGYFPQRIFVTQNVPVKIYMSTPSKVTMCFMLDRWGLKKGVVPGKVEELSFTPEEPGNYRFYCPVKSIEGMLTVREAPVAGQSSRGIAQEAALGHHAKAEEQYVAPKQNEPKNAPELRSLIED